MAKGIQTTNGKAFEYACVLALYEELYTGQDIVIEETQQLLTAQRMYESIDDSMQEALNSAARASIKIIKRLEPQLRNPGDNQPLYLSLQPDSAGIKGDVRDVLCFRKQNGWNIGLSCKHNHHAVKHSRLSSTIDFGLEWLQVPCSKEYFNQIIPLFTELRNMRDESKAVGVPMRWEDVKEKANRYYKPILVSFMDELRRIDEENKGEIPEAMIRYLLGRYDFYKVIADDGNRTTRVEAINIAGTLNCTSGNEKSITKIPVLKLPSQFYHIDFKQGSNNTIEVVCDEGWQISMRIHSASSNVEPSLKFDVNLISVPSSVHSQIEPWDTEEDKRGRRLGGYAEKLVKFISD